MIHGVRRPAATRRGDDGLGNQRHDDAHDNNHGQINGPCRRHPAVADRANATDQALGEFLAATGERRAGGNRAGDPLPADFRYDRRQREQVQCGPWHDRHGRAHREAPRQAGHLTGVRALAVGADHRVAHVHVRRAHVRDRRVDGGRGRRGRSLRSHLRDLGLGLRHGRLDLAPRLMHGQAGDRGLVFGAEHLVVIRPIIDAGANVHAARQRLRSGEFVRLLLIIGHDIGLLLFSCALSLRVYNYRNGRILHDDAARPICRPRRVRLLGVRNLRDSPRGRQMPARSSSVAPFGNTELMVRNIG